MKIAFTGTRSRAPLPDAQFEQLYKQIYNIKNITTPTEVHHGDCVGVDALVHDLADALMLKIVIHPPTDPRRRAFCNRRHVTNRISIRTPAPYLERNRQMVDEVDHLIAIPGTGQEQVRSGTWATVRYARKKIKHIVIIWPNGTKKEEYDWIGVGDAH